MSTATMVTIYNLGGTQALGRVSLRHAITMLHRQVAQVLEAVDGETVGGWPKPRAVELVRYVHSAWEYARTGRVPYSKDGLLRRDRHRCGYCGNPGSTVDHVVPKAQGGQTTWTNVVVACEPCNHAKADRTPEQAGMRLRARPFAPTIDDLYPKRRQPVRARS
jgi:5-methylcytosine-specific restriction endonuclease McrA